MHTLTKIGSVLGIPLKTYKYTKDKSMLKYARMMVEMTLDGEFPEYIECANERDVVIIQKIVYEWKPVKCSHCKMFGHTFEECRKKEVGRQEWRRVSEGNANAHQQTATDTVRNEAEVNDGFQTVLRGHQGNRATTHPSVLSHQRGTPVANSFITLLEAEVEPEKGRSEGQGPNGQDCMLEC